MTRPPAHGGCDVRGRGRPGCGKRGAEFTLAPDRGLVGSFGGFGGQLNQHVYAKISGPPPRLDAWRRRSSRSSRSSSASSSTPSEWTNADRMELVRPRRSRSRDRADAEINITWQGSTFEFAMRNMDRVRRRARRRSCRTATDRAPLGDDVQRAEHDAEDTRRVRAGLPLLDRGSASGACAIASGSWAATSSGPTRALAGRVVPVHGEPHGRPARRVVGARLLGLLGHRQDRPAAPAPRCEPSSATIPAEQHRPLYITEFGVRGLGTFEGEPSFEPGFWPDGTGMSATNAARSSTRGSTSARRSSAIRGTVKWDVYPAKYDAGTQDSSALGPGAEGWPARPVYNLLQLLTLTTEPRGGHIVEVRTDAAGATREAGHGVRLAGERHHDSRSPHGGRRDPDDVARPGHRTALGGLPANALFRLLVWNGDGNGTNVDAGFFATDANGAIEISVPLGRRLRPHDDADHDAAMVSLRRTERRSRARTLLRRAGVAAAAIAVGGARGAVRIRRPAQAQRTASSRADSPSSSGRISSRATTPGSERGRTRGESATTSRSRSSASPTRSFRPWPQQRSRRSAVTTSSASSRRLRATRIR